MQEHNIIKAQYNELKKQYNDLRRCFSVSKDVPFADVWEYMPVQYYPGKHPCEKPKPLIDHIINTSSRKGQTVADFFLGSGRTALSALELERSFVGCELDKKYYSDIVNKIKTSL